MTCAFCGQKAKSAYVRGNLPPNAQDIPVEVCNKCLPKFKGLGLVKVKTKTKSPNKKKKHD